MKSLLILLVVTWFTSLSCSKNDGPSKTPHAELESPDYTDMSNWAFHPDKKKTLLDNYNLDIAVIDEQLQIDSIISNPNNASVNTGVDLFLRIVDW